MADTIVTLTATAAAGSTFAGWSGACSGTGLCAVTMSAARSATASFTRDVVRHPLSVGKLGTGSWYRGEQPGGHELRHHLRRVVHGGDRQ